MFQTRKLAAQLGGAAVCGVVLIGTGAANWINPAPLAGAETEASAGLRAAPPATATAPAPLRRQTATLPRAATGEPGLRVAQWLFSNRLAADPNQPPPQGRPPASAAEPLYLWLVLDGNQAAIDDMRAGGGLKIEVHWVRDSASGAPDLVTVLTVGGPGLADTLAQEVRRRGFFQWHSWTRKDTLSAGTWTVFLTYPDGKPLPCGPDAQPCRFEINLG
jgi:hypothetical protein